MCSTGPEGACTTLRLFSRLATVPRNALDRRGCSKFSEVLPLGPPVADQPLALCPLVAAVVMILVRAGHDVTARALEDRIGVFHKFAAATAALRDRRLRDRRRVFGLPRVGLHRDRLVANVFDLVDAVRLSEHAEGGVVSSEHRAHGRTLEHAATRLDSSENCPLTSKGLIVVAGQTKSWCRPVMAELAWPPAFRCRASFGAGDLPRKGAAPSRGGRGLEKRLGIRGRASFNLSVLLKPVRLCYSNALARERGSVPR
jgi:hypothetical protein